ETRVGQALSVSQIHLVSMHAAAYHMSRQIALLQGLAEMRTLIAACKVALACIEYEHIPHAHGEDLAAACRHLGNGAELFPTTHGILCGALSLFGGAGSSFSRVATAAWRFF